MYYYLAIALATVSNFILGGIWYSLLFGKIWQKAEGITNERIQAQGFFPYAIAFVCSLIAAIAFNVMVSTSTSLYNNIFLGLLVGLLVATSMCINYQFAGRKMSVFLIDAGYHVARFLVYAIIFWFVK